MCISPGLYFNIPDQSPLKPSNCCDWPGMFDPPALSENSRTLRRKWKGQAHKEIMCKKMSEMRTTYIQISPNCLQCYKYQPADYLQFRLHEDMHPLSLVGPQCWRLHLVVSGADCNVQQVAPNRNKWPSCSETMYFVTDLKIAANKTATENKPYSSLFEWDFGHPNPRAQPAKIRANKHDFRWGFD